MARGDGKQVKDWRSTGRRRARRTLYRAYIPYECIDCGAVPTEPPKDAPEWFEDIWPLFECRTQEDVKALKLIDSQLQADHLTKDLEENSEESVVWRCPSCHKKADIATNVGESQHTDEQWLQSYH